MLKHKIELKENINIQELLQRITHKFASYHPNTIDGVKIDFEHGWVHLRPSNTEPILRIYAESKNETDVKPQYIATLLEINELVKN